MPEKLVYTVTEAAAVLQVSRPTLYKLIRGTAYGFPVVHLGNRVVIPKKELEKWLEEQSKRS